MTKKYYNTKVIETETFIEIWFYIDHPVVYNHNNIDTQEKDNNIYDEFKDNDSKKDIKGSSHYEKLKRLQRHYENTRWDIARLIDCNFDGRTKFLTLTFKENIKDIDVSNTEFTNFIRRLNYNLYGTKKSVLKYIAVWEKQKRGAIHYHIILFDIPFIKTKKIEEIWGNGFIKINKIDVDSKENRGRYISKYFSKSVDEKDYKKKSFFKSRNLKKPKVHKLTTDLGVNLNDFAIIYNKEYTRFIPEKQVIAEDKELPSRKFKQSKVQYVKIRKE